MFAEEESHSRDGFEMFFCGDAVFLVLERGDALQPHLLEFGTNDLLEDRRGGFGLVWSGVLTIMPWARSSFRVSGRWEMLVGIWEWCSGYQGQFLAFKFCLFAVLRGFCCEVCFSIGLLLDSTQKTTHSVFRL